jgi:hypothetical protein
MLIVNLTSSYYSKNVVEITFHCLNNDWFTVLFPIVDVDLPKMKEFYIGKLFYETKVKYKGRVFEEGGMDV